jgi:hypothetical protein
MRAEGRIADRHEAYFADDAAAIRYCTACD